MLMLITKGEQNPGNTVGTYRRGGNERIERRSETQLQLVRARQGKSDCKRKNTQASKRRIAGENGQEASGKRRGEGTTGRRRDRRTDGSNSGRKEGRRNCREAKLASGGGKLLSGTGGRRSGEETAGNERSGRPTRRARGRNLLTYVMLT